MHLIFIKTPIFNIKNNFMLANGMYAIFRIEENNDQEIYNVKHFYNRPSILHHIKIKTTHNNKGNASISLVNKGNPLIIKEMKSFPLIIKVILYILRKCSNFPSNNKEITGFPLLCKENHEFPLFIKKCKHFFINERIFL